MRRSSKNKEDSVSITEEFYLGEVGTEQPAGWQSRSYSDDSKALASESAALQPS